MTVTESDDDTTKAMTSTTHEVTTTTQGVTTAGADAAMGVGGVVGGVVGAIVAVAIIVAVVVAVVLILVWRARSRSMLQEPTKSQQNRESSGYDNAVYDDASGK